MGKRRNRGRPTLRMTTLKHPAGRPSKYSLAVTARILREVRKGCSREAAAALAGISAATLYDWQHRFPEFSEGVEKADATCERVCVGRIRRAGHNPRYWTANAWLLERKFPQRYGKVDRHVIHATEPVKLLPKEYIDAINIALGVKGEFKPLIKGELTESTNGDGAIEEDDVIDLPILP